MVVNPNLSFWVKHVSLCLTLLSLTFGVFLFLVIGVHLVGIFCVCAGIVCVFIISIYQAGLNH